MFRRCRVESVLDEPEGRLGAVAYVRFASVAASRKSRQHVQEHAAKRIDAVVHTFVPLTWQRATMARRSDE